MKDFGNNKYIKRGLFYGTLIIFLLTHSSVGIRKIDYREGRNKNICKSLKNDVLLYFIFVDNKETMPWTDYDIRTTLDSINIAIKWLGQKANENQMPLTIKSNYYIGEPFATIKKNLPQGSVYKTITEPNLSQGINEINLWADQIAKKAGSTFNIGEKDGIPEIKNPKNKERLIAYLRDENNVESVALIFVVNNYFKTDISVAVNTMTTDDVEFGILSYKYPSEIAYTILSLYGAAPLHKNPFRKNDQKIKLAMEAFPNDIMRDPYGKDIWRLELGMYTKYLIGWSNELSPEYEKLLTDRGKIF